MGGARGRPPPHCADREAAERPLSSLELPGLEVGILAALPNDLNCPDQGKGVRPNTDPSSVLHPKGGQAIPLLCHCLGLALHLWVVGLYTCLPQWMCAGSPGYQAWLQLQEADRSCHCISCRVVVDAVALPMEAS